MPPIVFGAWLPDQPDIGHPGLEEAHNCLPDAAGYGPFPEASPFGSSVTASAVTAGYATRDIGGNGFSFAGTATGLYRQSATGAWENVGRTATYASIDGGRWRFATFGNTLLAANGLDPLQVFILGSSARFADMSASASAPVATHLGVVRDFVFAGRISGAANRVQWSWIDNPLRWGRSQQNQSDLQDLPGEGGNVVGITGGDFATILTDRSIWRASYIGAPLIFRFDELAPGTGCVAPGSVARYQGTTFFLSPSGFMSFDGQFATPIGDGQVDDWFAANADSGFYDRMSAAIDPARKLYVVSFVSVNSTDGTPDRLLIFNFESRRWTTAGHELDVLFSGATRGAYSLEALDAFGTLESLPHSLDSEQWAGARQNVLAGFGADHVFLTFDATTAKTATLVTAEMELVEGHRALVTELRPMVQGDSGTLVTARMGVRDRLIDSVSWGAAAPLNAVGIVPLRANGRYQRARFDIAGGFERAHAFSLRGVKVGSR